MDLVTFTVTQFELFVLILARSSGIMIFAPFYSSISWPYQLKAMFSLMLAVIFFPVVPKTGVVIPGELSQLIGLSASELLVGLLIGFTARVFFTGFLMAGQIMGRSIGFIIANVVDPLSGDNISIIGQLLFLFVVVVFLLMGGHRWLLRLLAYSFHAVPVGTCTLSPEVTGVVSRAFANIFTIGVELASPVLIATFAIMVALGFVARAVPQMNIFAVGFALKIMVGLVVFYFCIPFMKGYFVRVFEQMTTDVHTVLKLLSS